MRIAERGKKIMKEELSAFAKATARQGGNQRASEVSDERSVISELRSA